MERGRERTLPPPASLPTIPGRPNGRPGLEEMDMLTVLLAIVGAFLLGMLVGDVMGDRGRLRRESEIWNAAVMDTLRMAEDQRIVRWVRPVGEMPPPPPRPVDPVWQDDPWPDA